MKYPGVFIGSPFSNVWVESVKVGRVCNPRFWSVALNYSLNVPNKDTTSYRVGRNRRERGGGSYTHPSLYFTNNLLVMIEDE